MYYAGISDRSSEEAHTYILILRLLDVFRVSSMLFLWEFDFGLQVAFANREMRILLLLECHTIRLFPSCCL